MILTHKNTNFMELIYALQGIHSTRSNLRQLNPIRQYQ